MNCLRCNSSNQEGSKYCKNCGSSMYYLPSGENSNSKLSDILLIIYIGIMLITVVSGYMIEILVPNWYESPTKYFRSILWILSNSCSILIPLSIRNKTLKIIGIIITSLLVIYWVYTNIEWMVS